MSTDKDEPQFREQITIRLDREIVSWIDEEIEVGTWFNRSHAIEQCMKEKKAEMQPKEKEPEPKKKGLFK